MDISNISQRSKNTLRAIKNLPIKLDFYTTIISEPYVAERKAVQTAKQLKDFTKRWGSIWSIPWVNNWKQSRIEKQIISGRYDADIVLRCISKNVDNATGCSHILNNKPCTSQDILVPALLMRLLEIQDKFGVSDGIALLQLTRALHEDLSDKDPADILNLY